MKVVIPYGAAHTSVSGLTEKIIGFYRQHRRTCLVAATIAGAVTTARTLALLFHVVHHARVNAFFRSLEPNLVHLFIHRRWSRGPSVLPHCLKVEAFLRLNRIPYMVHFRDNADDSPNRQLPFIVYNGTVVADSQLILQYLTESLYLGHADETLSAAEHAKGRMLRHVVETSLNYGLNRTTLVGSPKYMAHMFSKEYNLSSVKATVLVRNMRRSTMKVLEATGYAALSQEQYEAQFLRDLQGLEVVLQETPFLLGDHPTSYDCSAYAWLQIASEIGAHGPAPSFLTTSHPLLQYINRMTQLCFPDVCSLVREGEPQTIIPPSSSRWHPPHRQTLFHKKSNNSGSRVLQRI